MIFEYPIMAMKVKLDRNGRLVVPMALRRALGLEPGTTLLVERDGEELRVRKLRAAVAEAQRTLREWIPPDAPSPVDELIARRREEAAREGGAAGDA